MDTQPKDLSSISSPNQNPASNQRPLGTRVALPLTILLAVSLAGNAFLGFQFAVLNNKVTEMSRSYSELSETPATDRLISPTSIPINDSAVENEDTSTADMKDYSSSALGFKLQLPTTMNVINEMNDEYNRLVFFSDGRTSIQLRVVTSPDTLPFNPDAYFHMDMVAVDTTLLGGVPGGVYEAPQGYCDGPGCSEPYVAVVTKKDGDIYSLSFFGHSKLTETDAMVIQSFSFL